jgi:hypothetical protein
MATQTIEVDSFEPEREPVQRSKALSTTAVDLGATGNITATSDTGWELWCASAWLVGDSAGQLRAVAANEAWFVPSRSLAGTYAKVSGGTPTLVATGYLKAST